MCVFFEPVLLKLNSLVNFYKCFSKKTFFFLNAFVSETSFDIGYIKEFGFYFRCHVTEKFEVMFICFNQYVCVKERERIGSVVLKDCSGYIVQNGLESVGEGVGRPLRKLVLVTVQVTHDKYLGIALR